MKVFNTLTPAGGEASAARVIDGIAVCKRMLVVCGAGVSVSAGLQDFRSSGLWDGPVILNDGDGDSINGSDLFTNSNAATAGYRLALINKLMTEYRIQARTARPTSFLQFLHRAMDEKRVAHCLTRNFDGLETRDRPDLADDVLMLHGDNRVLTCRSQKCRCIRGEQVAQYDYLLTTGQDVRCPECYSESQRLMARGKRRRTRIENLRPAVELDETLDPELESGSLFDVLIEKARQCDLLLIAGTSLATDSIYKFMKELAGIVHAADGAVVMIDIAAPKKYRFESFVDFYLRMDVQFCSDAIMQTMDKRLSEEASDIWLEVLGHVLAEERIEALPPLTINLCYHCGIAIEKTIFPCVKCKYYFCFEGTDEAYGPMCVVLDYFGEKTGQTVEDRVLEFHCYNCFDHSGGKVYPHLIRPERRFYQIPQTAPRLVLIVYYLSQFWPLANQLIISVTNNWKMLGWACYSAPIRLQELCDQTEILRGFQWQPGTYRTLVVYVTHGTSGSRRYQIADNLELGPVQFLETTLKPVETFVRNSAFACAYLLTCGHVYLSVDNVFDIQAWINRPGGLHSLVGTKNMRLSPAYMVNLIAQTSITMLGHGSWNGQEMLESWLRDSLASTHTDLIFFSRDEVPQHFNFSPFQSRPLGKDLPSILSSCECTESGKTDPHERRLRKVWKVSHNAKDKSRLNAVVVKASCSVCGRTWHFQKPNLPGALHKVGGLYAAKIPSFHE